MEEGIFKNKYHRVNTLRLQNWDYINSGFYFFTICVKNMGNHPFGEIKNGIIGLSVIGCIIYREWFKTAQVRHYVRLDEFIVMPNHIHGIIEIQRDTVGALRRNAPTRRNANIHMSLISPQSGSLSEIIRSFKSITTKQIRHHGHPDFQWQRSFYDHIIRDDAALQNIRYYIKSNPQKWWRGKNNLK